MAPSLWSPSAASSESLFEMGTHGERQTVCLMGKEPTAWCSQEDLTCLVWAKFKAPNCLEMWLHTTFQLQ